MEGFVCVYAVSRADKGAKNYEPDTIFLRLLHALKAPISSFETTKEMSSSLAFPFLYAYQCIFCVRLLFFFRMRRRHLTVEVPFQ